MNYCVELADGIEEWMEKVLFSCAGLKFVGEMAIEFVSFDESKYVFDEENRRLIKNNATIATWEEIELDYGTVRLLTPT